MKLMKPVLPYSTNGEVRSATHIDLAIVATVS